MKIMAMANEIRESRYSSFHSCELIMDLDLAMRSQLLNEQERLVIALVYGLGLGKIEARNKADLDLWTIDNSLADSHVKMEALLNGYKYPTYPEFDAVDESMSFSEWIDAVIHNEQNPLQPPKNLFNLFNPKPKVDAYQEEEVELVFYDTSPFIESPNRKMDFNRFVHYDYFSSSDKRNGVGELKDDSY